MGERPVRKIHVATGEDTSKLYAIASAVRRCEVTELWLDGASHPIDERRSYNVGETIRLKLRAAQGLAATKDSRVAFSAQYFDPTDQVTKSVLLPAEVHGDVVAGGIVVAAHATAVFTFDPQAHGHVVGVELTAHRLCRICWGRGAIGCSDTIPCPRCKGDTTMRDGECPDVLVDDIRGGMLSDALSAGKIPIQAYQGKRLRLSSNPPGILVNILLENTSNDMVEIAGHILFQDEDAPAATPTPQVVPPAAPPPVTN